jgi:hypothetical protein
MSNFDSMDIVMKFFVPSINIVRGRWGKQTRSILFLVKWTKEVQPKPTKEQNDIRKLLWTQKEKVKKMKLGQDNLLKRCVNKPRYKCATRDLTIEFLCTQKIEVQQKWKGKKMCEVNTKKKLAPWHLQTKFGHKINQRAID